VGGGQYQCKVPPRVGRECVFYEHERLGRDDGRVDESKQIEPANQTAHLLAGRLGELPLLWERETLVLERNLASSAECVERRGRGLLP